MKYLIINIRLEEDSILKNNLNNFLKEIPYNSIIKEKDIKTEKNYYYYNYIMIKFNEELENNIIDRNYNKIKKIIYGKEINNKIVIDNIYNFIINLSNSIDLNKILKKMLIKISGIVSLNDIGISYSDGSSRYGKASGVSIKLSEIKNEFDKDVIFDSYTEKLFNYKVSTEVINDSTNNIGELTGIKLSIENFDDKPIQLIVSDSEYSIKCFREWIYNWRKNDFKNSSNKKILNFEIIKSIEQLLKEQNKLIIFKWTRGHDKDNINNKCDEIAQNLTKSE